MRWLAALSLCLALSACGSAPDTPEERVRHVLAALEAAAEARDVGAFRTNLSEAYRDTYGNDRRAVLGLLTAHFLRNRSVYVLSRVVALEIPEPGFARAEALVALAGTPIRDVHSLLGVHADLYRFDVRLREEKGAWRVVAAAWQPAMLEDFR